jgi:Ran GTPase-activating protein (RanGAP) involved in mRNA processing and transport
LDISGNRLCCLDKRGQGTYDASGLAALAKSIGNLKELNISNNFLTPEGAKILVPALEASGSLVSLNLAKNKLGVEGAKHVAEVLPKW